MTMILDLDIETTDFRGGLEIAIFYDDEGILTWRGAGQFVPAKLVFVTSGFIFPRAVWEEDSDHPDGGFWTWVPASWCWNCGEGLDQQSWLCHDMNIDIIGGEPVGVNYHHAE